jgi:hypothetical protein
MISTRSIALGLTLAAVGLAPAAAVAKNGADDPASHAGDDHGAIVNEPGDDKGSTQPEPGDDKGAIAAEPGDDKGGSRTEPADDNGGQRSGGSKARRTAGTCTGRSSAKLKVKPRNGRFETEFEVDQNRNGVRWRVSLRRNGTVVASTRATTRAPSGSLQVERRLANRAGTDTISARAVSPSGEICTASVTI